MALPADRASLEKRASDVLGWIASGKLTVRMEHNFALSEAAQSPCQLEGRQTVAACPSGALQITEDKR